jgi:membrane-bound metal-dependent hydrolase YbcI (DUF457 family)
MANYRGHLGGAVATCFAYIAVISVLPGHWAAYTGGILDSWQLVASLFVISMLFGLWPDVDTNSKAQDIFFGMAFVADIVLILNDKLEAAAYLGLLAMTPIVGKHRGWTHKKLAMFLVPIPILLIPYLYQTDSLPAAAIFYGAAVTGYFSHLLLDGLIWKRIRVKGGW